MDVELKPLTRRLLPLKQKVSILVLMDVELKHFHSPVVISLVITVSILVLMDVELKRFSVCLFELDI